METSKSLAVSNMDYVAVIPHSKCLQKRVLEGNNQVVLISLHSFKSNFFLRIVEAKDGWLSQYILKAMSLKDAKQKFEKTYLSYKLILM